MRKLTHLPLAHVRASETARTTKGGGAMGSRGSLSRIPDVAVAAQRRAAQAGMRPKTRVQWVLNTSAVLFSEDEQQ